MQRKNNEDIILLSSLHQLPLMANGINYIDEVT